MEKKQPSSTKKIANIKPYAHLSGVAQDSSVTVTAGMQSSGIALEQDRSGNNDLSSMTLNQHQAGDMTSQVKITVGSISTQQVVQGRTNAHSFHDRRNARDKLIIRPTVPQASALVMPNVHGVEEEFKSPPRMTSKHARQLPQSDAKKKVSPTSRQGSSTSSSLAQLGGQLRGACSISGQQPLSVQSTSSGIQQVQGYAETKLKTQTDAFSRFDEILKRKGEGWSTKKTNMNRRPVGQMQFQPGQNPSKNDDEVKQNGTNLNKKRQTVEQKLKEMQQRSLSTHQVKQSLMNFTDMNGAQKMKKEIKAGSFVRRVSNDDEEETKAASNGRVPFGGQIRAAVREGFFSTGMKPGGIQEKAFRAQSENCGLDDQGQLDALDDLLGSDDSGSVSNSDSDSNDIELKTNDINI